MPRPNNRTSKSEARVHFKGKQTDRRRRTHHESLGIDSPSGVSNLVAWWDFADASTLFLDATRLLPVTADADPILGVLDKSGAGNHLTGLITAGPLYKVNIQNGRSVAQFDGSNDLLSAADATTIELDTDSSVFIVQKLAAVEATSGMLAKVNGASPAAYYYGIDGNGRPVLDRPFVEAGVAGTNVIGTTAFRVLSVQISSTTVSHFLDGTANGTDTLAVGTPTNTTLNVAGSGSIYQGSMGEIAIYNRAVTAVESSAITRYLGARWNITVA